MKYRSCDTNSRHPANAPSTVSSCSRAARSRWFVGSSSTRRVASRADTPGAPAPRALAPAGGEPRALPAGEHADRSEHVLAAEQEPREEVTRALLVEPGRLAQRVEDRLVAGELGLGLGQERDARGGRARDVPIERGELPDERPDERRLPGAVGPDDRDTRAALHAQGRGPHDDALAVANAQRRRLEDRRAREVRRLEAPAVPRGADRRIDALEPRELLRATARLFRPLPGAEPVDVLLGARDLLLLPVGRPREGHVAVGPLARVA